MHASHKAAESRCLDNLKSDDHLVYQALQTVHWQKLKTKAAKRVDLNVGFVILLPAETA